MNGYGFYQTQGNRMKTLNEIVDDLDESIKVAYDEAASDELIESLEKSEAALIEVINELLEFSKMWNE